MLRSRHALLLLIGSSAACTTPKAQHPVVTTAVEPEPSEPALLQPIEAKASATAPDEMSPDFAARARALAESHQLYPASEPDECPPKDADQLTHCLLLELANGATTAQLAAQLTRDGYQPDVDSSGVALILSDAQIARLFGAPPEYLLVEQSSGSGTICNAYVTQAVIPKAYRHLIQSVSVGHQICE